MISQLVQVDVKIFQNKWCEKVQGGGGDTDTAVSNDEGT